MSKTVEWQKRSVARLQEYAERLWYPPFIGLLAALDNFVLIIPNDGILISSSMLTPRRWFFLALNVAIGSTLGALLLAGVVEWQGLRWILEFYPSLVESRVWDLSMEFFGQYGMWLVFAVALTPVMQHPAVIFAALANTPIIELGLVVFVGRFLKFLIMAYVGSHAPRYLERMWGMKGELKGVGIIKDREAKKPEVFKK